MQRWCDLLSNDPELASIGSRLLYQGNYHGSGYLATVGLASMPRVHPVFPILAHGSLWIFIVNMSPKYRDLVGVGRYALHSFPVPAGGEEFHLRGEAREVSDALTREAVSEATGKRQGTFEFEVLFECGISSALYTHWENWGTERAWPHYRKWIGSSDKNGNT